MKKKKKLFVPTECVQFFRNKANRKLIKCCNGLILYKHT